MRLADSVSYWSSIILLLSIATILFAFTVLHWTDPQMTLPVRSVFLLLPIIGYGLAAWLAYMVRTGEQSTSGK